MSWFKRDKGAATGAARMHCHDELERDLEGRPIIDDGTMMRWAGDGYSTSRHLLTLYAAARGLEAKTIVEIGFGRSSFVLMRAARENGGRLWCCDTDDYSYLLSAEAAGVTEYVRGDADLFYRSHCPEGVEMFFLDYLSTKRLSAADCEREIGRALGRLKRNGLVFVHDAIVAEYGVGGALERLKGRADLQVSVLPYGYGLGVVRLIGESKWGVIADPFRKKGETGK